MHVTVARRRTITDDHSFELRSTSQSDSVSMLFSTSLAALYCNKRRVNTTSLTHTQRTCTTFFSKRSCTPLLFNSDTALLNDNSESMNRCARATETTTPWMNKQERTVNEWVCIHCSWSKAPSTGAKWESMVLSNDVLYAFNRASMRAIASCFIFIVGIVENNKLLKL